MKKAFVCFLIFVAALVGCTSKKEPATGLSAGSPAYQLAKDLAPILSSLDPDKTTVLAKAKTFDVTAGDVILMFHNTMGKGANQLKSLEAERLKQVVGQAAVQVGERKLLLEAAVAAKVAVVPEEIKTALEGQYAQAGGEPQLLESLKSNAIDFKDFKKGVAENLTIQKYLQGVLGVVGPVTDAELKNAYAADQTFSARHILLLTQNKSAADKALVRKKMGEILAKAKSGEDFAALAKQYSEDPGSKDKGGLFEDVARGRMVKPFEDAGFSVPVGGISDIVETEYGYHILKVENRRKETRPFDTVKAELETQLKEQKQQAVFDSHLAGLKSKAGFEVLGIQ